MTTEHIILPSSLSLTNCISFANKMFRCSKANIYEFDFGKMKWFPPFSMVYLAAQINRFRDDRADAQWVASNYNNHSYAAHMGFFKAFDLQHGNSVGEALGKGLW